MTGGFREWGGLDEGGVGDDGTVGGLNGRGILLGFFTENIRFNA